MPEYGLKYELLCTTKKNRCFKTKVYFLGYTGDDIDRNVPISPFKLRKDKAAVVRGTSFEFSIREEVDFEFLEFYTNNTRAVKVELYDPSNNLIWIGYNLPQQYQVPYVPPPANVSFTATDGLGLLKNEAFTLTGRNSQLAIICHCVDKIGLSLGYSIAINLFEITHNHAYSPLAQTYEDSEIFDGLNCYEVLENILGKYDAEITQRRGRWAITCSADKKSTRMLYTSAGVYETTEAAPAVLDLGYPGSGIEVSPKSTLQMGLEPGVKQVTIEHDFGRKKSLLDNYEFGRYAGGEFTGWSKVGTFNTLQKIKDGKAYALLSGYSADDTMQIYQTIPVTEVPGEDFVFELNFAPIGRSGFFVRRKIQPIQMAVRMAVVLYDGATLYWLSKTEGWVTTPEIIEQVITSSPWAPVWNTIKIIASGLPVSGNLTVAMYRLYSATAPVEGISYTGIAFSEPSVYFLNAGELYPSGLKTLAVFDNSTEPGDLGEISILAADAPDLPNNELLYKKITRLSNGAPTTLWHRLGSASEYSLIVQLALVLASNNRIARQKLTGDIKGTGIAFDSVIKHDYNSTREFEIAEGTWDIYEETFNVTLLELLAWSSETITFTTESENTNSATATSGGAVIGVGIGNDGGGLASYPAAGIPVSTGSEWDASIVDNHVNWDTAYTDRLKWDGGSTGLVAATGRTSLGLGTAALNNTGDFLGVNAKAADSDLLDGHDSAYFQVAGTYLTTETDPTVYAWAKAATKPSYTYSEVGAEASGTMTTHTNAYTHANIHALHADDQDLSGYVTGTPWTAMGYLTTETDPTVYAWAKAATKPSYTYSEVGAQIAGTYSTDIHANITALNAVSGTNTGDQNLSGYVTGTPWTAMGYVTGTPWTAMGYVTGTPWTGMGYLTTETDPTVYAWAKAATKPSYTYSEVGAQVAGTYSTDIHANITALNAVSGTNTGNQDLSGLVPYTGASGNVNLGAYIITATNFQLSDSTLKHNIKPIYGLSKFDKVKWVQFTLKSDLTNKNHFGVIAQDLELIAPELIRTDEKGIKSVNYTELFSVKLSAMEEEMRLLKEKINLWKNGAST